MRFLIRSGLKKVEKRRQGESIALAQSEGASSAEDQEEPDGKEDQEEPHGISESESDEQEKKTLLKIKHLTEAERKEIDLDLHFRGQFATEIFISVLTDL